MRTPQQQLSVGEDGKETLRVLTCMEPQDVVLFFQANFRWCVTSLDDLVPPEKPPSLRVSVAMRKADHYADQAKLSRFYD